MAPRASSAISAFISLDFVTYGTGLEIAALQARLKTFDKTAGGAIGAYTLDANDSVAMTVEFDNGALGVVHMSRFATGKTNELDLTIHGDRGRAENLGEHHGFNPQRLSGSRHRNPDLATDEVSGDADQCRAFRLGAARRSGRRTEFPQGGPNFKRCSTCVLSQMPKNG